MNARSFFSGKTAANVGIRGLHKFIHEWSAKLITDRGELAF